jgi:DNA-binding NarL/FixJ family response regulator
MTVGLSGFLRKPIAPDEIVAFVKSTMAKLQYSTRSQADGLPVVM